MPRGCANRQAPGAKNGCSFKEGEKIFSRTEPCRVLPWAGALGVNACKDVWMPPEPKMQSGRRPGQSRAAERCSLSGCQPWGPRAGVLRSHLPSKPMPCGHTVGTSVGSHAVPSLLCYPVYARGWVTYRKAGLRRGSRDATEKITVPRLLGSTEGGTGGVSGHRAGPLLAAAALQHPTAPTEPVGVAVPWHQQARVTHRNPAA